MIHGLTNAYLYSAKKVLAEWSNGNETVCMRGTGFFITKDGNDFFVTNRHVVEPGYGDPKYSSYEVKKFVIESFGSFDGSALPQDLRAAQIENWKEFKFHSNENNDIACLKNVQVVGDIFNVNAGLDYKILASDEWLSQKLTVCDSIAYPGFPDWYDHQNNTPIFRMGTIASDPRFNYSHIPGGPHASRIAYEGFSTGGASGSPVFATQRGFTVGGNLTAADGFYREVKVIGINAGHFPDQIGHSGISYLYKSSAIIELIDSFT